MILLMSHAVTCCTNALVIMALRGPMSLKKPIPAELESVREAARQALGPISPVSDVTHADKEFLFNAKRSEAGRSLPPYYLVYFLLVDLLGFKNFGQFEKVSWSVPIDYQGSAFLIELTLVLCNLSKRWSSS